jgi:hypothetical protein
MLDKFALSAGLFCVVVGIALLCDALLFSAAATQTVGILSGSFFLALGLAILFLVIKAWSEWRRRDVRTTDIKRSDL